MTVESRKQHAVSCWMLAAVLGMFGVFLMLPELNWRTIMGLALVLWGNNLSQVRP